VVEAITLRQGDVIRLSVGEGQSVTITGWYVPGEQTNEEVWQRNDWSLDS